MLLGGPSVRPLYVRDISLISGEFSMKPDRHIHHVSGHFCKGIQGHGVRGHRNVRREGAYRLKTIYFLISCVRLNLSAFWEFKAKASMQTL